MARHARREIRAARRRSGRRKAAARRHITRHRSRLERACVRRHGRTPGRVTGLAAKASGKTRIVLSFTATGSDGRKAPPSRTYLVKQSRRPVRSSGEFRGAHTLCRGRCHFSGVTRVGERLSLTVSDLRRGSTYHYAVAARDNVSGRAGPRSRSAKVTTRR